MENIKFTKLENIEAWDITSNGYDLGCATNFSDGHMATIKVVDFEKTVSANSFEALSEKVTAAVKECSEKNNTFADFMNDWDKSLTARFGHTQKDLEIMAELESEAEELHPTWQEIEANDRFWGSEAYDF